MSPPIDEAAVQKEIAEVLSEVNDFVARWKAQECAASDVPSTLIKDADVTRALRLLEDLLPLMLPGEARDLIAFIETTGRMLDSKDWRFPSCPNQANS
ncbi:MAG: hypothetical protein KME20_10890 [Kaiparowitsia implicata GSE-PSE-MK54-09C]|nr:hypothetical protein [Kaiparowitsia implicata GSE-PSE-MK54-09C]